MTEIFSSPLQPSHERSSFDSKELTDPLPDQKRQQDLENTMPVAEVLALAGPMDSPVRSSRQLS